ncbi:hypothetical protein DSL72_007535 [Monilinia vaccinii-corymbosi]|uniref:Uncharacterized protein n=1 Tax=Monilinia vaccinii-corymbosi TaxID=61207 RepID=A0A8A3PI67_9HELO|nr:hypothetical protein DSL72_007535 [Monilinia vaccinii-corymbosi]
MSSTKLVRYSCGHQGPAPKPKKSLIETLSLGMAGRSTAEKTRTIEPPQSQKVKAGLKRVFSLGMADPPMLRSIEICPACSNRNTRRHFFNTRNSEADKYSGWFHDEVPGLDEDDEPVFQRRHTEKILAREIRSQQTLAPLEHGSGRRRELGKDWDLGVARQDGPSSEPSPHELTLVLDNSKDSIQHRCYTQEGGFF